MFEIEDNSTCVTIKTDNCSISLDNDNFLAISDGTTTCELGDGLLLQKYGSGDVVVEETLGRECEKITMSGDWWAVVMAYAEKIPIPKIEGDTCTLCHHEVFGTLHYYCPVTMGRTKLYCRSERGKRILAKMAELTMLNIGTEKVKRCFGCQFDRPSQREHECMDMSYNFEPIDPVSTYFTAAYSQLDWRLIDEISVDYPNNNIILGNDDIFTLFRCHVKRLVYELVELEYEKSGVL